MTPGNLILLLVIFMLHLSTFFLASFLFSRTEAPLRATVVTSATVLLALMGWRWNQLGGALLLLTLAHLFFWVSLVLISQSLFPVIDWERRKGAVSTLVSFLFGYHRPSFVVESGKPNKRISGRPLSRFGAGVIRVGVAQAAVLETTTQFSRVIGPGVSFVGRMESVKTVVDLHTQSRSAKVKALTKDGVPVEVPVFCLFRIASSGTSRATRDDFPFPREAIRRVFYRQDGVDEDDEGYSWDDYALQVAISRFQEILARFRLDQLFAPHDPDQVPRLMLASLLNTAVRNDLSKREIELVFAGFGTFEFPEVVQRQRIVSWQTEWVTRAEELQATGEADAKRSIQSARAAGQWELVQGMVNGLATAQGLTGIEPADLITWQLLNAMESMSADPILQSRIPQETVNALLSIRAWLEAPGTP
jgi:regulator of protease activity HflC (stomatin/prohibitin superfamily)